MKTLILSAVSLVTLTLSPLAQAESANQCKTLVESLLKKELRIQGGLPLKAGDLGRVKRITSIRESAANPDGYPGVIETYEGQKIEFTLQPNGNLRTMAISGNTSIPSTLYFQSEGSRCGLGSMVLQSAYHPSQLIQLNEKACEQQLNGGESAPEDPRVAFCSLAQGHFFHKTETTVSSDPTTSETTSHAKAASAN